MLFGREHISDYHHRDVHCFNAELSPVLKDFYGDVDVVALIPAFRLDLTAGGVEHFDKQFSVRAVEDLIRWMDQEGAGDIDFLEEIWPMGEDGQLKRFRYNQWDRNGRRLRYRDLLPEDRVGRVLDWRGFIETYSERGMDKARDRLDMWPWEKWFPFNQVGLLFDEAFCKDPFGCMAWTCTNAVHYQVAMVTVRLGGLMPRDQVLDFVNVRLMDRAGYPTKEWLEQFDTLYRYGESLGIGRVMGTVTGLASLGEKSSTAQFILMKQAGMLNNQEHESGLKVLLDDSGVGEEMKKLKLVEGE